MISEIFDFVFSAQGKCLVRKIIVIIINESKNKKIHVTSLIVIRYDWSVFSLCNQKRETRVTKARKRKERERERGKEFSSWLSDLLRARPNSIILGGNEGHYRNACLRARDDPDAGFLKPVITSDVKRDWTHVYNGVVRFTKGEEENSVFSSAFSMEGFLFFYSIIFFPFSFCPPSGMADVASSASYIEDDCTFMWFLLFSIITRTPRFVLYSSPYIIQAMGFIYIYISIL